MAFFFYCLNSRDKNIQRATAPDARVLVREANNALDHSILSIGSQAYLELDSNTVLETLLLGRELVVWTIRFPKFIRGANSRPRRHRG